MAEERRDHTGSGNHFSCSLTAVLIDRVRRQAGDDGVQRVLAHARSRRTLAYLEDIGNWVAYDEAIALWEAGAAVTGEPDFARNVGADAVRVLGASSTSTVLRTLGSPEELLRKMAVAAHRFSTAADLEAVEVRPGYAEIRAVSRNGLPRHRLHCEWTRGLLTTVTVLFGLAPARVEHDACQASGAPDCRYRVVWEPGETHSTDPAKEIAALKDQLAAMSDRLESVFATAADLIESRGLDETLARITERAALQVRAPRYLLAVRPTPASDLQCHHKGLDEAEARLVAERVLAGPAESHPEHWLVAPVSARGNHYGALVAMYHDGARFFPQERQLLEVYARYAASALETATAFAEAEARQVEAQRRYEESRALLELARRLASAGSSAKVAQRLADAVPNVVDCDRVDVYLWQEESGELVRGAIDAPGGGDERLGLTSVRPDAVGQIALWLERPNPEPVFVDLAGSPIRAALHELGAVAAVAVPIATEQRFLGCFLVSVLSAPERLEPSAELVDRLSGVAAHAVTALENGRLVDHITHQASHDQLTGLQNRMGFSEQLSLAASRTTRSMALFYIDLDGFKPINDEFGHAVGDEVLRAVAERLGERVRTGDTVARLGGDEFAVLCEDVDGEAQVEEITSRLARAFDAPLAAAGERFAVRASIGRAVWPADVDSPAALLRHADAAMYETKRADARHRTLSVRR
jgi:diguanylate cyclase (GGDEF)-like protein